MQYQITLKNILLLTVFCLFTGCTTLPKPDMSAFRLPGPVSTVVAAWEPAVSNGENPMRGFGGRVYFYDQDQTRPVKIEGTVVVYLFDEDDRAQGDNKPNEGIVFSEKALKSKEIYKKSELGHSYNLWIPYDAAGPEGSARKVSLIVRYIPKKGGASPVSKQATVHLPGRQPREMFATRTDRQETQPVSAMLTAARLDGERTTLAEENVISNMGRPQTMESVTIR